MTKTVISVAITAVIVFVAAFVANKLVVGEPNLVQCTASALTAGAIVAVYSFWKSGRQSSSDAASLQ